jgi:hypothetical protein
MMTPGQWQTRVSSAVLLAVCLLVENAAVAEILPTSGTFKGVYHQDRWGVGHYSFFLVHPDLHEKLAKFEGELIRLEVVKGVQPVNPGPSVMLAVGKVQELPEPPLEIRAHTRPGIVQGGQPFQLIVEVTNRSTDDSFLYPTCVISTIQQPIHYSGQRPDEPSFLVKEYTQGQLSVGGEGIQMGEWNALQGPPNLTGRGGRLLLSPGASYAWVASFPEGVSPADGELKVEVVYALADPHAPFGAWKSEDRYEKWQAFPVQQVRLNGPAKVPDENLLSVSEIDLTAGQDGWNGFRCRLLPAEGKTVRVPGTISRASRKVDVEKYAHVARLYGLAADGSTVELEAVRFPDRDTEDGIAQLLDLPEAGAIISGRFRKQSGFALPIVKVSLSILTDSGIETVVLSDNFKDTDVSPPAAFGSAIDGVKMRIRSAKAAFKEGESLQFHVQAVNVSQKPVCWWRPSNGLGDNVIVEIDGTRTKQPDRKPECIGGWAAEWTCANPDEWTVTLPDGVKLAKGRHTIQYTIVSWGGQYTSANNQLVPLVRGNIVSNRTTFAVE